MSENSIIMPSQRSSNFGNVSMDIGGLSALPTGLPPPSDAPKSKPKFAEFTCSYVEVCPTPHLQ